MEVIFIQDVPNVALTGEIKKVADGYYRNYLLPNHLALPATPETVRRIESREELQLKKRARHMSDMAEVAQKLEGYELKMPVRAGVQGRLYGAVTSADIARAIEERLGINLDKRKIELSEPLKQTGNYDIRVRLSSEIVPRLRVILDEGNE